MVNLYKIRKIWSIHDRWSLLEVKIFIVLKKRTLCTKKHLMFFSYSEVYETFLNRELEPKGQKEEIEILLFEDEDG